MGDLRQRAHLVCAGYPLRSCRGNGQTPAQVSLSWLLQRPGVTAPIMGVRTLRHLEDNLGATGWTLDAGQMQRLEEVSQVKPGYPESFISGSLRRK